MDFYIDVKYRQVIKRTFPWFRKEKAYEIEAIHIANSKSGGIYRAVISAERYNTPVKLREAIVRNLLMRNSNTDSSPIVFFGIDTAIKSASFYTLFEEKPYWMPGNIMDIQLYADIYVIPKVDLVMLAEKEKIDFIETRPLSLPERKEVIKQHVDYPRETSPYFMYELHKFYTDLERDFTK